MAAVALEEEAGRAVVLAGVWLLNVALPLSQTLLFEKYPAPAPVYCLGTAPSSWPGQETRSLHSLFLGWLQFSPHSCLNCEWLIIEVRLTKATRLLQVGCPSVLIPSSEECIDA